MFSVVQVQVSQHQAVVLALRLGIRARMAVVRVVSIQPRALFVCSLHRWHHGIVGKKASPDRYQQTGADRTNTVQVVQVQALVLGLVVHESLLEI